MGSRPGSLRADVPEDILLTLGQEDDPDVLSAVGRNVRTPESLLVRIAQNHDADVRRSVVLNRAAPREALRLLVEDPYPLNRAMLARHGNLFVSDLEPMLGDPEPQVRFTAASALIKRANTN